MKRKDRRVIQSHPEPMVADAAKREAPVLLRRQDGMLELILNRPRAINTLNAAMIRLLQKGVNQAREEAGCRAVLLKGAGGRGFCAGGDVKALAQLVREQAWDRAMAFFQEEYALDLDLHGFPKPIIVLAAGITMGGGLGLAAGAEVVVVAEDSRLAMPETGIGFFPDVGATGWLFAKCPPGYPEYLALTGLEVSGPEAVRLGLATHLVRAARLPEFMSAFREEAARLPAAKEAAVGRIGEILAPWTEPRLPPRPDLDAWVARHFAGQNSIREIQDSLSRCREHARLDAQVRQRLEARSPTALELTLGLLRLNQNRPLKEVLAAEARAARFLIAHPDYLEGIRARLLDRDQQPRWQPAATAEVRAILEA